jgi:hypothetical protein
VEISKSADDVLLVAVSAEDLIWLTVNAGLDAVLTTVRLETLACGAVIVAVLVALATLRTDVMGCRVMLRYALETLLAAVSAEDLACCNRSRGNEV